MDRRACSDDAQAIARADWAENHRREPFHRQVFASGFYRSDTSVEATDRDLGLDLSIGFGPGIRGRRPSGGPLKEEYESSTADLVNQLHSKATSLRDQPPDLPTRSSRSPIA